MELPIFVAFARRHTRWWRGALAGAAGTALTHPVLWFGWPRVVHWAADSEWWQGMPALLTAVPPGDLTVWSGELTVCAVESVTFWLLAGRLPIRVAVAAAFIANAASFGLGQLLRALGWWP